MCCLKILDMGDDELKQHGWVELMSLTNRIAKEVSSVVEKTLYKIRSADQNNSFEII